MKTSPRQTMSTKAFTVVELLIVIIVIAIIATMVVVVYRGTSTQAYESSLKSDLSGTAANVASYKLGQKKYPSELTDDLKIASAEGGTMTYVRSSDDTYCIDITSSKTPKKFYVTQNGTVQEGDCTSTKLLLQTITTANCPTTRTMAVDARDNHTYWVQKMPDNRCWMLTNLAYAGGISNGGANTHGDVKTLENGSSDGAATYTVAKYYINPTIAATNSTTYPTSPSTSTDGGTTNPQYGYLYNWCAAMGNQQNTAACLNATTPAYNANVSICPAGWRLPTGGESSTNHEFELLANSIAANANTPQAAINLQSTWLAQRGGAWLEALAFFNQGQSGRFWAGSQYAAQSAHYLYFNKAGVGASSNHSKSFGFSVRCITPA